MKGHVVVKAKDVGSTVFAIIGAFMSQTSGTFPELTKPGRKPKKGKKS